MGIALVTYIPDNCVMRTFKYAVQCNGKFNYAEITCKMTAVFSNNVYYSYTDFLSQLLEFFLRKLFDVFRRMNFGQ